MNRLLILLCVVGGLHSSTVVRAQSAIGQLEGMTGQKIQRFKPSSQRPVMQAPAPAPKAPKSTGPSMNTQLTGMLLEGIFSEIFSAPSDDSAAKQRALEEQQRQERERLEAEKARRTAVVKQQRMIRDRQTEQDLEALSYAMSEPWDGRGDSSVVDLRGKKGVVEPIGASAAASPDPKQAAEFEAQMAAQEKLRQMAKENEKVAVLAKRLGEVEKKLELARLEAQQMQNYSQMTTGEFGQIERDITEATDRATERGISLALGGLLNQKPKVMDKMNKLLSDSRTGREVVDHLNNINDFVEFTEDVDKLKADVDWLKAKRNLMTDLGYVADRLELGGAHYTYGKAIIDSSVDVYKEVAGWRRMNELAVESSALRLQQRALDEKTRALIGELKESRLELAREIGVDAKDLKGTGKKKGLGSLVPSPL